MSPRRALRGALDAGLYVRLFLFEGVVDAGELFVIAFFGAIAAGAALAWFFDR